MILTPQRICTFLRITFYNHAHLAKQSSILFKTVGDVRRWAYASKTSVFWYAYLLFCACLQSLLTYYHGLFCVLFKNSILFHSLSWFTFTTHHITVCVPMLHGIALGHCFPWPVILSLKLRVWATWCLSTITFRERCALRDFELYWNSKNNISFDMLLWFVCLFFVTLWQNLICAHMFILQLKLYYYIIRYESESFFFSFCFFPWEKLG